MTVLHAPAVDLALSVAAVSTLAGYYLGYLAGGWAERRWPRPRRRK